MRCANSPRRAWLIPVLLFAAWSGASLPGDELYLADGRVIEGEIISAADADMVDIRVGSAGLVAIQHFPRAKVLRVVHRVSARQTAIADLQHQIDELSAKPGASAADWWTLARKFQDRGEQATARDLATRVITIDRHHADARKLLGMVRHQGVWMRANEIATARGEVFFRGAWVSWAQQEDTLADEAQRRGEQLALRKERDEQRRQSRLAAAAAAESSAALQETYTGGYYRSPYYNGYTGGFGGIGYGFSHGGYGGGYYGGYPYYPIARPYCPPRSIWHIGATGGGNNHAWRFGWSGSSSGGY
jgi:hypothetical protein